MTISFNPIMYLFGGLILFTSLVSIITVILSLRFNAKRIDEIEIQFYKKYISKKDIFYITNKIEDHVERIETKIEKLIELK